ncbi:MAG: lysophospholipid acyltransferase family protein [Anaerolineales bacterium]
MTNIAYSVVTTSIKSLTRLICNVDDTQLSHVPDHGPLIIACNHVNFMEVPVLYTHLQPRAVTGFAKAETWDNPAMGFLFNLWGAIPIQRGEADTNAFKSALNALQQGKILAIAPEGTRSGHGRLGRGQPGVVVLAEYSQAPILPLVYFGGERLRDNINRFKRTDFNIRVGRLFKLKFPATKLNRELRNIIVQEIMYQIALLLPVEYRGYYSDLSSITTNYLNFV